MSTAKTAICNLALGHLGQGVTIANIITEQTAEAKICRRFYDLALEKTQSDFMWSFNTAIGDLELIEEEPDDEWAFSYQFPVAALELFKIQSGSSLETRQTRVPYRVVIKDDRKCIFTDKEDAIGEWAFLQENTVLYTPNYTLAHSFMLASLIAPAITAGDPFKLGDKAAGNYNKIIVQAKINEINQEQQPEEPESEFTRARE